VAQAMFLLRFATELLLNYKTLGNESQKNNLLKWGRMKIPNFVLWIERKLGIY
jgi:hypothetical protein